ncbi:hypothetical protein Angca_004837, partial [Angiostrongylus cantonensis]
MHQKKVTVTARWSAVGLTHHSSPNLGEMITAENSCQQIDKMHSNLQRQQSALVSRKGPVLLHDDAQHHIAELSLQKLKELGYESSPRPRYSPDVLPTDYHFFKLLDNFLQQK